MVTREEEETLPVCWGAIDVKRKMEDGVGPIIDKKHRAEKNSRDKEGGKYTMGGVDNRPRGFVWGGRN